MFALAFGNRVVAKWEIAIGTRDGGWKGERKKRRKLLGVKAVSDGRSGLLEIVTFAFLRLFEFKLVIFMFIFIFMSVYSSLPGIPKGI